MRPTPHNIIKKTARELWENIYAYMSDSVAKNIVAGTWYPSTLIHSQGSAGNQAVKMEMIP